jgi:hypothetical protein
MWAAARAGASGGDEPPRVGALKLRFSKAELAAAAAAADEEEAAEAAAAAAEAAFHDDGGGGGGAYGAYDEDDEAEDSYGRSASPPSPPRGYTHGGYGGEEEEDEQRHVCRCVCALADPCFVRARVCALSHGADAPVVRTRRSYSDDIPPPPPPPPPPREPEPAEEFIVRRSLTRPPLASSLAHARTHASTHPRPRSRSRPRARTPLTQRPRAVCAVLCPSSLAQDHAVWAKLRGYPPWPAQVLSACAGHQAPPRPRPGAVLVHFFGTYDIQWLENAKKARARAHEGSRDAGLSRRMRRARALTRCRAGAASAAQVSPFHHNFETQAAACKQKARTPHTHAHHPLFASPNPLTSLCLPSFSCPHRTAAGVCEGGCGGEPLRAHGRRCGR